MRGHSLRDVLSSGGGTYSVSRQGEGTDPGPGQDNSCEVQRIGGGNLRCGARFRAPAADCAEQLDCFRPRELLANETRHKSAAANLAPGFQAAKHRRQIAPWRRHSFARQQIAEQHPPAQQQLFGKTAYSFVCRDGRFRALDQGPAAHRVSRARFFPPALAATPFGVDQGSQVLESICGHQAGGGKFPQGVLHFARQAPREPGQIAKEACATV